MKKAVVTGLNGTLAPVLAMKLKESGVEVVPWNRSEVSSDDKESSTAFIEEVSPDIICHLAMGNADWAGFLADITSKLNVKLLFTSTAMVFHHEPNGPHYSGDVRTAQDDYGKGKIECEDAILTNNPDAIIARIGWQIDWESRGNNMFSSLCETHKNNGHIEASEAWFPASSFMGDTCDVFLQLLRSNANGLFQIDSNREDKLSFADIVQRISNKKRLDWQIKVNQDYVHDQRLPDDNIKIPNLSNHL